MTIYQKRHYEDVAQVIAANNQHGELQRRAGCIGCAIVEGISKDFADLFAADNPLVCIYCGDDEDTTSICTYPENEGHDFKGFNRERFLAACGLEGSE